jgi:hypothetical protein
MQKESFFNLLSNQHLFNVETASELRSLTEKYPWFHLAWMMYLKNLKYIESKEYNSVLKKAAVQLPDRKLLYNFLNTEIPKKTDKTENENPIDVLVEFEKDSKNKISNPLIDNFLNSNPRSIRRTQGEDSNLENANRIDITGKSDTENEELITETLAAIYFEQKNYEKALSAYKKLSLKYPEKSIYFAARIKEIEKIKNTNS